METNSKDFYRLVAGTSGSAWANRIPQTYPPPPYMPVPVRASRVITSSNGAVTRPALGMQTATLETAPPGLQDFALCPSSLQAGGLFIQLVLSTPPSLPRPSSISPSTTPFSP